MNRALFPSALNAKINIKPVTPQNGFGVPYRVDEHLFIELYLHEDCADKWYRQFGALRQPVDATCVETAGNANSATDALLQAREATRLRNLPGKKKRIPPCKIGCWRKFRCGANCSVPMTQSQTKRA